jgi:anthranilate synthase component I
MKKNNIHTAYKKILADTHTPVSAYLKLRDRFRNCILLESSDYHAAENSYSFICCEPLVEFRIEENYIIMSDGAGKQTTHAIKQNTDVTHYLKLFSGSFCAERTEYDFLPNGLFGYTAYNAIQYFEEVNLKVKNNAEKNIPDMMYAVYHYILAFNHFKEEIYIYENTFCKSPPTIEKIESILNNRNITQYKFATIGEERSNLTDRQFMDMVKQGKQECKKGNLFQIVLSREYVQEFRGDEFNLYRALRSINPSPYLFYFDYGDFRIMGSSPEAQLVVKNHQAQIHPIAGTVKRTGNVEQDATHAKNLLQDKKEKSEHVMLVDLARNDLSRSCINVNVEVFSEVQYYSHVIHLVSKVTGEIKNKNSLDVFADTFPAGTLSGAPKIKAMQLIDACEQDSRGYYGGAIGYIGFNGDFNHAIIIRSFLSKHNKLYCRAGAGVVIESKEENELQEVNNKLKALKMAIVLANNI